MKHCHYLAVMGLASMTAFMSCQDEDFGYEPKQIAYRTNFEKTYGKIDKDQIWDLSSYNLNRLGLEGGPSAAATRGLAPNYTGTVSTNPADASAILKTSAPTGVELNGGWYSVNSGTLDWLNGALPEGTEYKGGKSFVLGKPEDNFAIIPIYQGHAGMCWELHLVDKGNNNDYKLWEKSQGIRYTVDFDQDNAIDVARHEIIDWGIWADADGDGYDDDCGQHQKYIPIGYLLKAWEPSFGDLVLSCPLPSSSCYINGRIIDAKWNSSTNEFDFCQKVDYRGDNESMEFSNSNQTYTIPASEVAKMKEAADNLYFELWWNNEWVTTDENQKCYFDFYNSKRATFHLTTANKSAGNHVGKVYLEGRLSNEVGHTVEKAGVEAQPILIDGSKITSDMYLYLKVTKLDQDNPGYTTLNSCQRSDENMMVALPITGSGVPNNIGGNEYMIIGCEDANNTQQTPGYNDLSDWDYNDIVFLLVGQGNLPKVKEVICKKRYMIEDLGATFDFDFNDMVVDVTQTVVTNYLGQTVSSGAEAVIRHLCGTIPFQIKIGNTTFDKMPGKVNCNPAEDPEYAGKYQKTIDGWDFKNNNITVTVWPGEAEATWDDLGNSDYLGEYPQQSATFGFPENGEFPYIIACDQDVMWMEENVSVPENWFKTWPRQYFEYNNMIAK